MSAAVPRFAREALTRTPRWAVRVVLLGGVLLGAGVLLWSRDPGLGAGDAARLLSGIGVRVLTTDDGDGAEWRPLDVGDAVPVGAAVATGGEARFEMADGALWLGPSGEARLARDRVDLTVGEAVVDSDGRLSTSWHQPGTRAMDLPATDAAAVEVAGAGVYGLRGSDVVRRVGVYAGTVALAPGDGAQRVARLRQSGVARSRQGTRPVPLTYRPTTAGMPSCSLGRSRWTGSRRASGTRRGVCTATRRSRRTSTADSSTSSPRPSRSWRRAPMPRRVDGGPA